MPYFKVHKFKWGTSEENYRRIVKKEHQGAVFDVVSCRECRAFFVKETYKDLVSYVESHPIYRSETIRHWFDQSHFLVTEDVCRRIAVNETLSPVEARYRQHLNRVTPLLKQESRFMDVGANVGTFAALLAAQRPHTVVHACETNPAFLVEGQTRYPHLIWVDEPLTNRAKLEPFDVLYVSHVIEHIWDLDGFVEALLAHLRPDGYLMVATPDGDHPSAKRDGTDWWAYIVPHHCQVLTLLSLDRLMVRHGLQRIDHATEGEEFWALYQPTPNTAS
ncbi:Methyltransferase domain-containing protein [Azospirillum oryzae]|uniref:Methyltransferase domain-containing protein n=1 Tax=Azospirillum oryzae TaxID=286727 RepID=A0A1X7EY08_9PROT|nr:Methyltransferase domain-containing protein [Azospirillum oryzae]